MKKKDNRNNETNPGWNQKDQWYLQKHDNTHEPNIQIFTDEDWEDENKELRVYFCAICKSRLDFLKETKTIWRCNECMQYYDTSIQDVPIKDMGEPRVKVWNELEKYPTYDFDDTNMVFMEGVDPDAETSTPSNVEVVSDDGFRKKHIRVKGLPTEALAVMNEMDERN